MSKPLGAYTGVVQTPFDFWGSPVTQAPDGTLVCPGFSGNTIMTNPWDVVFINSAPTPGLADVTVTKERDIDKKKAAGTDGARITVHGVNPATIEIRLTIWTPDQLKALNELWPILFPNSGKGTPTPYDVQHPKFKLHNIKSIQVIGGSGPDQGPVQRSRSFSIRAIEYLPPGKKTATVTPIASKGSLLDAGAYPTPGTNKKNLGPN